MDTPLLSNTPSTMSFIINDIAQHSEHIARACGMISGLWDNITMRRILSDMTVSISIGVFEIIKDIHEIDSQGHGFSINDITNLRTKNTTIITTIGMMSNYFTTLHTLGFVSIMNKDVMVRELHNLKEKINTLTNVVYNQSQGHSTETIKDTAQIIKDTIQKNTETMVQQTGYYHTEIDSLFNKTNNISINDTSNESIKDIGNTENTILKDTINDIINLNDTVKDIPMSFTKSDKLVEIGQEVNRRKQSIVDVLKMKHSIHAHELSILFPNYSRKTLQRDMADLAGAGIIKKTGEKRWSEYILVAN